MNKYIIHYFCKPEVEECTGTVIATVGYASIVLILARKSCPGHPITLTRRIFCKDRIEKKLLSDTLFLDVSFLTFLLT